MIGYLVVTHIEDDWAPQIGVKYSRRVSVITQFYYRPDGCYDIYKVEFKPKGSMRCLGMGEGYRSDEYIILELV